MKILVSGDLHGSPMAAQRLVYMARLVEPDEVWQAGDLGYWPRQPTFTAFMEMLGEVPAHIYFADGNHEDHHALGSGEGRIEPRAVWFNVTHQPRGSVRVVDGTKVLFFGGAQSVDETHRRRGVSWFYEELPNQGEWLQALDAGKADVVVAHEAPLQVNFHYPPHEHAFWPVEVLRRAEGFRRNLTENLLPSAQPDVWFHGHHHKMKYTNTGDTRFYSLNCDGHKGSFAIYDTETGEAEFVHLVNRTEYHTVTP